MCTCITYCASNIVLRTINLILFLSLKIIIFQLQQLDLPLNSNNRHTAVHLVTYVGVQLYTTEVTRTTGQCSRVQSLVSICSTCRCWRELNMVAFGSSRIHKRSLLLTLVMLIHNTTVPLCLLLFGWTWVIRCICAQALHLC